MLAMHAQADNRTTKPTPRQVARRETPSKCNAISAELTMQLIMMTLFDYCCAEMQNEIIVLTSAVEDSCGSSRPSLDDWVLHTHWAHLRASRQITSKELTTQVASSNAKRQLKDEDQQHYYMACQSTRFCDLTTSLCTAK